MREIIFMLIVVAFSRTFAQDQVETNPNLADLFTTPNTDFLREYEEVTRESSTGFGAIEKCGEGRDLGIHKCVRYFNCDAETKTIIPSEEYDGTGLIDIRFGNNQCDDYLDVCCKIPDSGIIPPEVTAPTTGGEGEGEGGGITPTPSVPTPVETPNFCGIRNPNGVDFKITGNNDNEAEYGEFKWMLVILKKQYNPDKESFAICGASLITPTVVLTGAHCVYNVKNSDIKVRAGEWDTQTERERYVYQERDVKQIIVHESFTSNNLFNDVALVILTQPFDAAPHIGTICLPSQGQVFNSKECFASGWGKDIFGQKGRYQVILKKIQLPTISHNQCENSLRQTRLGQKFKLHDSFICAGGETGKDTCTGDGGSPLVCPDPNNPNRYMQAGIVAWGIGCGQENVPGVYADVSKFRTWIENHMARLNLETAPFIV